MRKYEEFNRFLSKSSFKAQLKNAEKTYKKLKKIRIFFLTKRGIYGIILTAVKKITLHHK